MVKYNAFHSQQGSNGIFRQNKTITFQEEILSVARPNSQIKNDQAEEECL